MLIMLERLGMLRRLEAEAQRVSSLLGIIGLSRPVS